jgi:pentose-5-phosphate-3-epimerase
VSKRGVSGQTCIPDLGQEVLGIREMTDLPIGVDGVRGAETAPLMEVAGAQILVADSTGNMGDPVTEIRNITEASRHAAGR